MSKYFAINNKNQAITLNYLGFKYMKFNDDNYGVIYSFENTNNFKDALNEIRKLKNKYR